MEHHLVGEFATIVVDNFQALNKYQSFHWRTQRSPPIHRTAEAGTSFAGRRTSCRFRSIAELGAEIHLWREYIPAAERYVHDVRGHT